MLSVNNVGISSLIAPSFKRSANTLALSLFSPTTILEGYKLSYKAFPSLKNSGEKIRLSMPYFSFIDLVKPTGIVDLIIMIDSG